MERQSIHPAADDARQSASTSGRTGKNSHGGQPSSIRWSVSGPQGISRKLKGCLPARREGWMRKRHPDHGLEPAVAQGGDRLMASITTLFSFDGTHGAFPLAGLIADAAGDLFGTTQAGGGANNDGTVFEIVKTASGYANTPTVLFSFDGTHGAAPFAGLTADAARKLVRHDITRWREQRNGFRDREDSVRICQHPHCAVQLRR